MKWGDGVRFANGAWFRVEGSAVNYPDTALVYEYACSRECPHERVYRNGPMGEFEGRLVRRCATQFLVPVLAPPAILPIVSTWSPYDNAERDWPAVVTCEWCRTMFTETYGRKQAAACAVSVWQTTDRTWLAQGHYGSRFDTVRFRFADEYTPPQMAWADPVCDDCIAQRIDAGHLVEVEGSYL